MTYNPKVVSFNRSSAYVHHRAMVNRRENNPMDALELMRHAAEQSPDNEEYQLDLAELYCEMGCHEQSIRLLLDLLAKKGGPAECFYGLALNQLGYNDISGARQSLRMYRTASPEGAHSEEVGQLSAELELYDSISRPAGRKLYRAMRAANKACDALQAGDAPHAIRLFERSLSMYSEQYEMRAMYAMALLMDGQKERAQLEAQRATEGFPPSMNAFCVAAQVFAELDQKEKARALLKQVMDEKPDGIDLRMLVYSMSEVEMHEEIAECTRLALQETPYDRMLLHVRATALHYCGVPDAQAARFWQRILRMDPEDTVAGYYHNACLEGKLTQCAPIYEYQVPQDEFRRRAEWLSLQFAEGPRTVLLNWTENPKFREMILWAAGTDNDALRRVAITILSTTDDERAKSRIRSLLFRSDVQFELKFHAASLLRWRGADMRSFFPASPASEETALPDAEDILADLPVAERQLIRYANEILEDHFSLSAEASLGMIWVVYRQNRGTHADPLTTSEAVSAALVYSYLAQRGQRVTFQKLASLFGCSVRMLVYYAGRIAEVMEHLEGDTNDENL